MEEAAAALEEAIELGRAARSQPLDPLAYVTLVEVCIEMGQFERAVEWGKEGERAMELPNAFPRDLKCFEDTLLSSLRAALATAYEGLGRTKECYHYHMRALNVNGLSMDTLTIFEHQARVLVRVGQVAKAEELLTRWALHTYTRALEMPGGLWGGGPGHKDMDLAVRRLVEIKRQLGKEAEAQLLEWDLDETDAILASISAAALNELREQMRAEAEQQQAAAAAEETEEQVDGVTAAAAQLQIDTTPAAQEEQEEPEPESEECAICLNDLPLPGEEGATFLAYTHAFHTGCLERWKGTCLEKKLRFTCALCRGAVVVAAGGGKA